jgi:hypothetical protein
LASLLLIDTSGKFLLPLSLTPVANLPLVPINDTGGFCGKFAASVIDTGGKFATGVVELPGYILYLPRSEKKRL